MLASSSTVCSSLDEPCPFVNEVDTRAREVAQMALSRCWDETGAQQAVAQQGATGRNRAQQIGQPLGILDVGLAARDRLGVVGIDDEDLGRGPRIGPQAG
jgi:hypothetical protein